MQATPRRRLPCCWLALAGALLGSPALADHETALQGTELLEDAPEAPGEAVEVWDVRLGGLGGLGPDYEGSDGYEPDGRPYVRVEWRERLIFRGRSLTGYLVRTDGVGLGGIVQLASGREEHDSHDLDGLGTIDRTPEAGAVLRLSHGHYRARLTALQDVGGEHGGARVELRAGVELPLHHPLFLLAANATWASDGYMNRFFGIDAVQSARSGLPRFRAGAGLKDVGVSLASRIPVFGQWSVLATLSYKRLLHDAADSPIVDRRGDPDQVSGNLGLMYRF